uniref:Uncharacterized protein n=1 Tax=Rhizophora mucronata TaxID=61149 RepID=A0A2P2PPT3_RHIMU
MEYYTLLLKIFNVTAHITRRKFSKNAKILGIIRRFKEKYSWMC